MHSQVEATVEVASPSNGALPREQLADVKFVKGDKDRPWHVTSKVTKVVLGRFGSEVAANSFVKNIAYEVLSPTTA